MRRLQCKLKPHFQSHQLKQPRSLQAIFTPRLGVPVDFLSIQNSKFRDNSNTIISETAETEKTSDWRSLHIKPIVIPPPKSRSVLSATSHEIQASFSLQSQRPVLAPLSVPLTDLEYAAKFRSEISEDPEITSTQ